MVMDICLTRIDDRLIHGQVATAWTKSSGVSRILVISDEVAQDNLRKLLLKQAAPPGIKSHVLTIAKLAELYDHELFDHVKVMLLFTSPEDVLRAVSLGVELSTVNIGGMRFTEGKKMITNFVSVDERDIEAFKYLAERGIELEVRKVPSDRQSNMIELLKKEKML